MRRPVLIAAFGATFAAGLLAARIVPQADAQTPRPMTPQIINLMTMTDEEIGPLVNNTDLRSRSLVATRDGTINVQSGNVLKHFHRDADEIQLILDGTGSFWLDDREVQVRPGDLIVIPRGTHHAGSRAATGRFRSLAIKLPPQRPDDTHPVP
jgi:mannose-6-phosphate isomerase-like protein (cupin superfamily)